jgi:hypothetical protein
MRSGDDGGGDGGDGTTSAAMGLEGTGCVVGEAVATAAMTAMVTTTREVQKMGKYC